MSKFKMMFLAVFVSTILLLQFIGSTPVLAYPSTCSTTASTVKQSKSKWCWVACSVSVIKAIDNVTVSQNSYCIDAIGSTSNEGQTLAQIRGHLYTVRGIDCSLTNNFVGFYTTVKTEIYNGRPLLTRMSYATSSSLAHAVLITGYDDSGTEPKVTVMDPAKGTKTKYTYEDVRDSYLDLYCWTGTLDDFE